MKEKQFYRGTPIGAVEAIGVGRVTDWAVSCALGCGRLVGDRHSKQAAKTFLHAHFVDSHRDERSELDAEAIRGTTPVRIVDHVEAQDVAPVVAEVA